MVTCPWCGTNYQSFQPNCQNCGGPLSLEGEGENPAPASAGRLPQPPPPPRPISNRYVWRLLSSDGAWIVSLVFLLLGAIFSMVGLGLSIAIITILVGIIFGLLGLGFLGGGGALFAWRYQKAQKVVSVLRDGISTDGQITELRENYSVSVNGRNPWTIGYEYQLNGQAYRGQVSTLNQPGPQIKMGNPVRVLYLTADPNASSIYPHP